MSAERRSGVDRRALSNKLYAEARIRWMKGREDSSKDAPKDPLYKFDPYYIAGYNGERRVATRRFSTTESEVSE